MYMMLDSIPGANQLQKVGLNPKDFNNPFVVHGGEGFTQISGRWRLGGYAGIGTSRISNALSVTLAIDNNGLAGIQDTITPAQGGNPQYNADITEDYTGIFVPTVEAKFTFMISAVTLEYVVPIFRDLEIASGAMFGLGRTVISIDQNTGTPRWGSSFNNNYGSVINEYLVVGHTDTKGTNKYNLSLSIKRAEVVKEILINYGIKQNSIKILGKGEESLAVNTPDDTKQPANRRVEIKKTN